MAALILRRTPHLAPREPSPVSHNVDHRQSPLHTDTGDETPRRVLVLNQFALPRSEGGGTRHIDLFSRLTGWTPLIIAGNRNHYSQREFTTDDDRFTLVTVPPQNGGAYGRVKSWLSFATGAAAVAMRTRHVDAVVASTPHLLAPLTGWAIARLRRVPYVLEVRDLWPESFVAAGLLRRGCATHRLFLALERFVTTRADAVVAVTGGWEEHFAALGVPEHRVVVVPNGTERADHHTDVDRDHLREALHLDGPVAVFAGAHGPKDGIDFILDAAAKLPDVTFLLYGDGPAKPAAIARGLEQGLTNVVFRDPVPKAQLMHVLRACDVGVHSVAPLSVFALGMSPNKLFDYLACGLPVASNAGAPIESIIGKDRCGRVGDAHSLADGIREILDSTPEARSAYLSNGHHLIDTTYSRTASSARLTDLLDGLVKARTARR